MPTLFDIEVRPLPEAVSRFTKPFPAFDPVAIKTGNIKDPLKIAEKVNGARADHEQAEKDYWENAYSKAALNPLTGSIICIGTNHLGSTLLNGTLFNGGESGVLEAFWSLFSEQHGEAFVFWSGSGNPTENFDPDFIIKRSWLLGVAVPPSAFDGRYLGRKFVDLAAKYLLFKREAYCTLSDAADQMGLFESNSELRPKNKELDLITGANFHEFWDGKNTTSGLSESVQRTYAISYLRNDVNILSAIANRIL